MSKKPKPSYARPTVSSLTKTSRTSARHGPSAATPSTICSPLPPSSKSSIDFQSSQKFKTAYLSTLSSRRHSSVHRFRFFDLPSDVRNMVYSYITRPPQHWPCAFRLQDQRPISLYDSPYPRQALPMLMGIKNKQWREEFGSYYFTQSVVIYYHDERWLQLLFREVGRVNYERFVRNPDAYVVNAASGGHHTHHPVDPEMLEKLIDVKKLWISTAWDLDDNQAGDLS